MIWEDTFPYLLPGRAARLHFLKIFALGLEQIPLVNRLNLVNRPQKNDVEEYTESININNHLSFYDLLEGLNSLIKLKKIVIFIDGFDGISIGELENFLATLRELYQKYKKQEEKANCITKCQADLEEWTFF